jgi:DNA polymerase-3 subunit alpha
MLGIYLTGHPLKRYMSILKLFSTVSSDQIENIEDGSYISIGGILTDLKKTSTKKGDRMAWGEIEDITGRLKVLFYPKVYKETSSIIKNTAILLIKGRLEKRDGITIIADEVSNLNSTGKKWAASNLEINLKVPTEDTKLNNLNELFTKNKGNCPVFINLLLEEGDKRIKIKSRRYSIDLNIDFLENLQTILGNSSFHIGV